MGEPGRHLGHRRAKPARSAACPAPNGRGGTAVPPARVRRRIAGAERASSPWTGGRAATGVPPVGVTRTAERPRASASGSRRRPVCGPAPDDAPEGSSRGPGPPPPVGGSGRGVAAGPGRPRDEPARRLGRRAVRSRAGPLTRPPRGLHFGAQGHWRSWLARLYDTQEVTGSSPVWPTDHERSPATPAGLLSFMPATHRSARSMGAYASACLPTTTAIPTRAGPGAPRLPASAVMNRTSRPTGGPPPPPTCGGGGPVAGRLRQRRRRRPAKAAAARSAATGGPGITE